MTLTQEQIKKIAEGLSKVPVNADANINNILSYFDLLQEVNTDGVLPTYCVIKKESKLREDVEFLKDSIPNELLNCSKQKVIGNQIAVGNIMK